MIPDLRELGIGLVPFGPLAERRQKEEKERAEVEERQCLPADLQIEAILSDTSLSNAHKIPLLYTALAKKLDADIEDPQRRVRALQGAPTDVIEKMKLTRLYDKRSKLFDIMREGIELESEATRRTLASI